jgi:hypothetical protein
LRDQDWREELEEKDDKCKSLEKKLDIAEDELEEN